MWLDGVCITNFRFRSSARDEDSIRAYGLRHITVLDDSITSDEEARARAEAIVASRGQPQVRIEDVIVLGAPELEPGSRVSLQLPEATGEYVASEIEYVATPREGLRTRITCSSTGEPSPGWPDLLSGRRRGPDAGGLAREIREEDKPSAPQTRTPASFVVAAPGKTLRDLLTEEGRIRLSELERWPLTGEDIDVPGLDEKGRLRLTEVGEKAGSLDQLASSRGWGGDELLLAGEIFSDKEALRLRPEVQDYNGRRLTDLVRASKEIGPDGTILPGAITADKLAYGIDASGKGFRAADSDTLDGLHAKDLTLDKVLEHGNRAGRDIEFSLGSVGPVLVDRATGERWRLYIVNGILLLEKLAGS